MSLPWRLTSFNAPSLNTEQAIFSQFSRILFVFISPLTLFSPQAAARCQEGGELLRPCRAQVGLCDEDPRYQPSLAQGQEGPAAPQTEADQQRGLHQDEQGHHQHAQDLR